MFQVTEVVKISTLLSIALLHEAISGEFAAVLMMQFYDPK
jgi:hypothetical protein